MELPFGGYDAVKFPHRITQGQLDGMVEYVKGVMVGGAEEVRRVEGEMRTSERYRREAWKKLVVFEDHKRFFWVGGGGGVERFQGVEGGEDVWDGGWEVDEGCGGELGGDSKGEGGKGGEWGVDQGGVGCC